MWKIFTFFSKEEKTGLKASGIAEYIIFKAEGWDEGQTELLDGEQWHEVWYFSEGEIKA